MVMTLERLEEISDVCRRIQEIDEQIQAAYNTYKSPQFSGIRTRNNKTADPVARAFDQLQLLDMKKAACLDKWIAFEKELCQIPEPDIQAIIRWRFLIPTKDGCRMKWNEVNRKVYGYPDHFYARKRFERYIKNAEGGEDNDSEE